MFDELIRSVRMHLSERLTSPLLGAYVVSWIIWNFRFLLIVFSNEGLEEKLHLIDNIAFPTLLDVTVRGVLGPLVTALGWIFVYPYPAKHVYEFARRRQRELLNVRRAIEDETPLTIEDTRKFRRELAIREQGLNSEIDRKDQEIAKLQLQLESAQKARAGVEEGETISIEDGLTEDFLEMLSDLVSNEGRATKNELVQWSKFDRIKTEYLINELLDRKLFAEEWNDDLGENQIVLTQPGRAMWLKLRPDRKR